MLPYLEVGEDMKYDGWVVRTYKPFFFRKNICHFSAVFLSVCSIFFCGSSINVILFTIFYIFTKNTLYANYHFLSSVMLYIYFFLQNMFWIKISMLLWDTRKIIRFIPSNTLNPTYFQFLKMYYTSLFHVICYFGFSSMSVKQ